jgi:L-histidine Nalpha-methyltransferase
MNTPRFHCLHRADDAALAAEASAGLLAPQAQVSPKFLYDALGSRLFEAITALPEYYPTRTEAAIVEAHGPAMAAAVLQATGAAPVLVDLGAGDGAKAARFFPWLKPRRYVAVDIAVEHQHAPLTRLALEHPAIEVVGVGLDFSQRLALPSGSTGLVDEPALVFFPGSSIGNFSPEAAARLLREMKALAHGGAVLIGVDLLKDPARLEAAYDDALGVTAAFNLNLLLHLNRLLGADFQVRQWRHVALFNPGASRIEMHLEARETLTVRWGSSERHFARGERMHTENSCKWTVPAFAQELAAAGFGGIRHWSDAQQDFAVFVARV